MRMVLAALTAISAVFVAPIDKVEAPPKPKTLQVAMTCFSTGEQSSGMTKICYYDCLGSPAAITIGATQLCPLSINR